MNRRCAPEAKVSYLCVENGLCGDDKSGVNSCEIILAQHNLRAPDVEVPSAQLISQLISEGHEPGVTSIGAAGTDGGFAGSATNSTNMSAPYFTNKLCAIN